MALRCPPALRAGSLVAVVAPASGFDRDELFRGLAWLATRYRLRIDQRIFARSGFLAGADADRASVLARAMEDPEVEAILCARGGYGAMRIIDELPWDAFVERPKHLVGFSDVTALHVSANARGIATVHGPNVTGLGRSISAAERASLIASLENGPLGSWTELEVMTPGEARGPVVGGNLALVCAMAAAGRLVVPSGAIVVLEDVTERPYRIDRMLTSLLLGGHLARASAIVFGGFTECEPGPDGVTVDDVLRERTRSLGIPVMARAPFGHGAPNHAFRFGSEALARGDRLDWTR
ncbi:MAG TPA: LD-carboxypeptidase [Labilithrix sp.]|jgi:muramoyltetrapeptide carboxypeptidase|nr:LD-carboxypeptidase [Labilithrix sp.]